MIYARTASDLRVGDGHTSPVAERCPGVAPPPLFLNTKAQRRNEMRERFTRVDKVSSLRADARRKDMWGTVLPLCHFERSEQSAPRWRLSKGHAKRTSFHGTLRQSYTGHSAAAAPCDSAGVRPSHPSGSRTSRMPSYACSMPASRCCTMSSQIYAARSWSLSP